MRPTSGTDSAGRAVPTRCLLGATVVVLVIGCASRPGTEGKDTAGGPASCPGPRIFEKRGHLVCLAEEMRARHGARVPPVHAHIAGFRVAGKLAAGEPRYYTILKTAASKALFEDSRYGDETLVLYGRVFVGSAILDVTRCRWIRKGRLYDLFYWCEVCSITSVDPGACACCQGDVEFRERLTSGR